MVEGTALTPQTRRRRIIERPRLTQLLDTGQGRIKLLVGPAGYGKTTLARQWLEGKEATWYRGPWPPQTWRRSPPASAPRSPPSCPMPEPP